MRRTELPIPPGYIGLGDAFERAYAQLARPDVIASAMKWIPIRRDLMPAPMFSGAKLDVPTEMFEGHLITPGSERIESDPERYKWTHLEGLDPQALEREEEARGRIEFLLRDALSSGPLCANAYDPGGVGWGEIPDRDSWRRPNLYFRGLETFVDPETSRGPDVRGSPVFVEEKAFRKWLEEAIERAKLVVRTGKRGRPSVVKTVILDEFMRRRLEGTTKAVVTDEARELRAWLKRTYPVAHVPAVKTIRDTLSRFFRD